MFLRLPAARGPAPSVWMLFGGEHPAFLLPEAQGYSRVVFYLELFY